MLDNESKRKIMKLYIRKCFHMKKMARAKNQLVKVDEHLGFRFYFENIGHKKEKPL
jgi:hypothetical protein